MPFWRVPFGQFQILKRMVTRSLYLLRFEKTLLGHTPSRAGIFPEEIPEKFRKRSESVPGIPLERYGWGPPKPNNLRHLRRPEHFQNWLPPSTAGGASFFRNGSREGLSELVMDFPAVLRAFKKTLHRFFRLKYAATRSWWASSASSMRSTWEGPPRWLPRCTPSFCLTQRQAIQHCKDSISYCAKPLPEDLGDDILHFYPTPQREKLGGFLVAKFLSYFPKDKWLKFCHSQNFR